jgi:TalC/MipB family fructose-6-phosphate aldolase
MELFLDSVVEEEIREAFELGFLTGLTTTPTFMHRDGVTDVDGAIVRLAKMVPQIQIEALGESADEIQEEADRLLGLGLNRETTVLKLPVSLEGVKACKRLSDQGIKVNVHLVYTLQQAYMAMAAGAAYICPLVGRLQDEGHDALGLIDQCVNAVDYYGYGCKVMFSSVRHPEHVRNAINLGVHAVTVPWKVMKVLTENTFTTVGAQQFFEHTRLMTLRVRDVISDFNPTIHKSKPIVDALVVMTRGGFGAVTIVGDDEEICGVFTDGDLRRMLEREGETSLHKPLSELDLKVPIHISGDTLLYEASKLLKETQVDTICVVEGKKQIGMLDIQDIIEVTT